ncbi:MAG: hypothetical protein KDA41_17605, partial [Planctomycetales bacterium]|nr:hypothetical protein [Planctomycetales bacterium]
MCKISAISRALLTAALLAVGALSACAQREGAAPAESPKAIPARNVVTLRERVGEQVTVFGQIARTARSSSGHQFLNFSNSELTAICLREDAANFVDGAPADAFANKSVELTGTLELYKGKLQIRLRSPQQIRVADPAEAEVAKVTLEEVAPNVWQSPAGLRYAGRDPTGLTRVEHIARHCRDMPDRDGPHGVFDGGQEAAFAVIDEAWKIAADRKLRPLDEGDRSSYTVRMGRRIGYLGGTTGAQRGHPQLDRVFIVFETGTKNI